MKTLSKQFFSIFAIFAIFFIVLSLSACSTIEQAIPWHHNHYKKPPAEMVRGAKNFMRDQGAVIYTLAGKTTILMPSDFLFEVNSSTLRQKAMPMLNALIEVLKSYPNTNISIHAYTDNIGTIARQQKLSDAQATKMAGFLWRHNITLATRGNKVTFKGMGAKKPVATNAKTLGQAYNRRIKITLLSK